MSRIGVTTRCPIISRASVHAFITVLFVYYDTRAIVGQRFIIPFSVCWFSNKLKLSTTDKNTQMCECIESLPIQRSYQFVIPFTQCFTGTFGLIEYLLV